MDNQLFICNISFQTVVEQGPPLEMIKRKWNCLKSQKRVETTNILLKLDDFVPEYAKPFVSLKRVSITMSNPKGGTFHLLIIGEKCQQKIFFALQIIYECMYNDFRIPIKLTPLKVINMVIKWNYPSKLLKDFNIMGRELKNLCRYYDTKFPQLTVGSNIQNISDFMLAKPEDCSTNACNLSLRRIATSAGVKRIDHIPKVQQFLDKIVSKIDGSSTEENILIGKEMDNIGQISKKETLSLTNSIPYSEVAKHFNKSDFSIEKKRYLLYVLSNVCIKKGKYLSLDFCLRNIQNFVNAYGNNCKSQLRQWLKIQPPFNLD